MDHHAIVNTYLKALKKGDIILYPTDSTIGLGCDVLNKDGVEKIYRLKQRDRNKSFILLVSSIGMLKQYVDSIHPRIETLLVYHRRPLTIIYKANKQIPEYLTSNDKTIGIRLIHHPFCNALIKALGRPITSTSANVSGKVSPIHLQAVPKVIRENAFYDNLAEIQIQSSNKESVIANYNEEGELLILRG